MGDPQEAGSKNQGWAKPEDEGKKRQVRFTPLFASCSVVS
jgi:hypothetical protein